MPFINITLPYQVIGKKEGNKHLLHAYHVPNRGPVLCKLHDLI